MKLTQTKLNTLIDLYGDVVFCHYFDSKKVQDARKAFNAAIQACYSPDVIPEIFSGPHWFRAGFGQEYSCRKPWLGYSTKTKKHVYTKVAEMTKQLNQDFNGSDFIYTGKYRSDLSDRIMVGVLEHEQSIKTLPDTHFYEMMSVLAHPVIGVASVALCLLEGALYWHTGLLLAGYVAGAGALLLVVFLSAYQCVSNYEVTPEEKDLVREDAVHGTIVSSQRQHFFFSPEDNEAAPYLDADAIGNFPVQVLLN